MGPPETAVWARPDAGGPWWLDIKIELSEGGEWVYRRNPRVRRPLESIGRTSTDGIPYLDPEIVSLYRRRR